MYLYVNLSYHTRPRNPTGIFAYGSRAFHACASSRLHGAFYENAPAGSHSSSCPDAFILLNEVEDANVSVRSQPVEYPEFSPPSRWNPFYPILPALSVIAILCNILDNCIVDISLEPSFRFRVQSKLHGTPGHYGAASRVCGGYIWHVSRVLVPQSPLTSTTSTFSTPNTCGPRNSHWQTLRSQLRALYTCPYKATEGTGNTEIDCE